MGVRFFMGPLPPFPTFKIVKKEGDLLSLEGALTGEVKIAGLNLMGEDELVALPKKAFLDFISNLTAERDEEEDEEEEGEDRVPDQDPKGPLRVSQSRLVRSMFDELVRQGITKANSRQMNAVIHAADEVVEEMARAHIPARPDSGIIAWAQCDEVGHSSLCMARTLRDAAWAAPQPPVPDSEEKPVPRTRHEGIPWNRVVIPSPGPFNEDLRTAHPNDPDDLSRCLGLLAAVPDLRPFLPQMAEVSPEWAALIEVWEDLERTYQEELPSGRLPKTYEMMKAALKKGAEKRHQK